MAQLTPLPLTVSRFSKIQIGFTFLVPTYPGSPGKRAVKRVCVCVTHLLTVVVNRSIFIYIRQPKPVVARPNTCKKKKANTTLYSSIILCRAGVARSEYCDY